MALKINLTPDVLRELIEYDPESGRMRWKQRPRRFFTTDGEWRRWNGRYAGKPAMRLAESGYVQGYVMRQMVRGHRAAWAMHYAEWPVGDVDHINGDTSDNRIANLRDVTRAGNARNAKRSSANTSGVTGVSRHGQRWRAYIHDRGRHRLLGVFPTIAEAAAARKAAEAEAGYHPNHGRSG